MNTNTFIVSQTLYCASHPEDNNKHQSEWASFPPVPNLGAAVLEELEEFGDHNVERSVQSVAVEQLRRVLADLLQCSKRALRHGHTQRGCQIKRKHTGTQRREWDCIRVYNQSTVHNSFKSQMLNFVSVKLFFTMGIYKGLTDLTKIK